MYGKDPENHRSTVLTGIFNETPVQSIAEDLVGSVGGARQRRPNSDSPNLSTRPAENLPVIWMDSVVERVGAQGSISPRFTMLADVVLNDFPGP